MKHWVVFPAADPNRGWACAKKWIDRGFQALVLVDNPLWIHTSEMSFHLMQGPSVFPGYYKVANAITMEAFKRGAELVTCIGDDMLPDPTRTADDIQVMYFKRFPNGEGVLQATGDEQGEKINGEWNSQRICGSPTFGRGWYETGYKEIGGFCSQYRSFYGDEDLLNVAKKRGVLWQEPSIKIDHVHWAFGRAVKQTYHDAAQKNWEADQKVFFERKAAGFSE